MHPLELLRHHVTGAIERGERDAIVEVSDTRPVLDLRGYYARMRAQWRLIR